MIIPLPYGHPLPISYLDSSIMNISLWNVIHLLLCAPVRVPTGISEEEKIVGEDEDDREVDPPLTQPPLPALTGEQKLASVYGEKIHQNDCSHLDGGVTEDMVWQEQWRGVMALPPQRYDVPLDQIGRLFVASVVTDLSGIVERSWNTEWFIVIHTVILQGSPDIKQVRCI